MFRGVSESPNNIGDHFLKSIKNHSGKASALNSNIFQKIRAKNPDEKIYLDFGDQFFKIDQKSFSPGSRPPGRDFSKKWGKQKILKFSKNPKKSPHSYPPWGALLYILVSSTCLNTIDALRQDT